MLRANHLAFSYTMQPLLSGCSLQIEAGQIGRISGANGSGKSTLLMLLAGVYAPDAGMVENHFARTHMLRAKEALEPVLQVGEYLAFWQKIAGKSAKEDMIFLVESQIHCHALSDGWKQKVACNRLLQSGADLWLMDEPFAHLDAASIAVLYQAMRRHVSQGGAVLFSSHYLPEDVCADEVLCLR